MAPFYDNKHKMQRLWMGNAFSLMDVIRAQERQGDTRNIRDATKMSNLVVSTSVINKAKQPTCCCGRSYPQRLSRA
jgi:hypothetical protein